MYKVNAFAVQMFMDPRGVTCRLRALSKRRARAASCLPAPCKDALRAFTETIQLSLTDIPAQLEAGRAVRRPGDTNDSRAPPERTSADQQILLKKKERRELEDKRAS